MYFIGTELTGNTGFISMVLIERIRKELQKYYQVIDMKRSPLTEGADDLVADIMHIYHDPKYTIRKPRFSQIGRPKKIIHEKPLIFAGCFGKSTASILQLKRHKIPVTCIFATDQDHWRMEADGTCMKSDFFVPKNHLVRNLLAVIDQNRLILGPGVTDLIGAIKEHGEKTCRIQDIGLIDDLLLALAMPVWYYENLLSIRPRSP